jgi:hypothetical protein
MLLLLLLLLLMVKLLLKWLLLLWRMLWLLLLLLLLMLEMLLALPLWLVRPRAKFFRFISLLPLLLVDLLHRAQLLLQLHPPVLEPYFDLALGEAECVGYLDASPARKIMVEVKFFLEL